MHVRVCVCVFVYGYVGLGGFRFGLLCMSVRPSVCWNDVTLWFTHDNMVMKLYKYTCT